MFSTLLLALAYSRTVHAWFRVACTDPLVQGIYRLALNDCRRLPGSSTTSSAHRPYHLSNDDPFKPRTCLFSFIHARVTTYDNMPFPRPFTEGAVSISPSLEQMTGPYNVELDFKANSTFDTLRASKCTNCEVTQVNLYEACTLSSKTEFQHPGSIQLL